MNLPLVLAGPILRRCEPGRVLVWLATSRAASVTVDVSSVDPTPPHATRRLGGTTAHSLRLGARLYVHLASVEPDADAFPSDALLGYDVAVDAGDGPQDLAALGLVGGGQPITYATLPLPTFFLRSQAHALHLLHGSCRLLHGNGEDALGAADEVIEHHPLDLARRPSALLLTGDQIYGDEVAGALVPHLRALADALRGEGDARSVPGVPPLGDVAVEGRGPLIESASLTSGKGDNHLLSFGEFVAMYATAFNEQLWPERLPTAADVIADAPAKVRRRFDRHRGNLRATREALPAVRRLLANVPTYMAFDDHDVTDDWNLTGGWRERVHASPAGRRVVANALASFWAFQGWGNEPALFDDAFIDAVAGFCAGDHDDGDRYDTTLWDHDRWSYVAPTHPPTLVLDTRSQRAFDSSEGAARLIGPGERDRVVRLLADAGHRAGDPLVMVSAVPLYGLELQERRQKYLVGKVGPYEIDFEAWHSNLAGYVDFMRLLVDDLGLSSALVLSGDVHYGINVEAEFHFDGTGVFIAQLVSSSLKHSGASSRTGIGAIGAIVSKTHRRLGWDSPPSHRDVSGVRRRALNRAANTDEWAPDSPVLLAPRVARRLGISRRPDFRESRTYVPPSDNGGSVLVGANNVGLVTIDGPRVDHRLLARVNGRTTERVATVNLPGWPERQP